MFKSCGAIALYLFLVIPWIAACGSSNGNGDDDKKEALLKLLPDGGEVSGWESASQGKKYADDKQTVAVKFSFNGAIDHFEDAGWVAVAEETYEKDAAELKLRLDIVEMAGATEAESVYASMADYYAHLTPGHLDANEGSARMGSTGDYHEIQAYKSNYVIFTVTRPAPQSETSCHESETCEQEAKDFAKAVLTGIR